jgi:putative oxidoreductase
VRRRLRHAAGRLVPADRRIRQQKWEGQVMAADDNQASSASPQGLNLTDGLALQKQDGIILLARICLGAIFVSSGVMKLAGLQAFSTRGWPAAWFFGPLGATVELIGGLLLIMGLATRYAALVMLLFMIIATFSNHRFWDYPPAELQGQRSHFFKNLSIFGGFLVFYAIGAGRYSIDWMLRRRR